MVFHDTDFAGIVKSERLIGFSSQKSQYSHATKNYFEY